MVAEIVGVDPEQIAPMRESLARRSDETPNQVQPE
jgi:hypothetical protein